MANSTRILFVSGEVAPFAAQSEIADLVRLLPERLQEQTAYDMRIMMPRYGNVSERRNRLHEVIRLSGSEVAMGTHTETLKVKVASIPGIRLQVYFMDNVRYFKRKGIFKDKAGKAFEDNAARALFFARATMETIRKLGWAPDVIHAFGWMSALVPYLVRTEGEGNPLFSEARLIYTPGDHYMKDRLSLADAQTLGLVPDERVIDRDLNELAVAFADTVIHSPAAEKLPRGSARFSKNPDDVMQQALNLYLEPVSTIAA